MIGSLGRLSPEKGYDLAVQALAEVLRRRSSLSATGSRARLEKLAAGLGVSERVRVVGWCRGPAPLPGGLRRLPAGLPNRGTPPRDLRGNARRVARGGDRGRQHREAVQDGATGYLVPAEDADALASRLREVLADPESRVGSATRAASGPASTSPRRRWRAPSSAFTTSSSRERCAGSTRSSCPTR